MFFNPPAEGIVDVAVAFSMVQLFDTHFGQAVFGIVILGTADGLFAGQAASAVVLKTGVHSALAAQGFPVQQIALNLADDLTVMD